MHVERLENKKANEGKVVEELLSKLDLQGVIFTFDALHCKKNSTKNRRKQEPLCSQSESQSTQTAQSQLKILLPRNVI